jgi:hypothetical protein
MTITGREHERMRDTAARLRDHFAALAAERNKCGRDDFTADGHMLRWQEYELFGMLTAVNDERAELNKPPVAFPAVEKAERQAGGHSDYARKFSWYCAELVHGVFPLVQEADR